MRERKGKENMGTSPKIASMSKMPRPPMHLQVRQKSTNTSYEKLICPFKATILNEFINQGIILLHISCSMSNKPVCFLVHEWRTIAIKQHSIKEQNLGSMSR